jgi:hypothetical protein
MTSLGSATAAKFFSCLQEAAFSMLKFAILDQHFRADMTQEQDLAACKDCIKELRTRFMINQLLQLHIIQIITNHHFECLEQFSV